jgi:hypothetical protein
MTLLSISAFWLIPAFIAGAINMVIAIAIFGARDIDLPRYNKSSEMDESEKFYHSQSIGKFKRIIKN